MGEGRSADRKGRVWNWFLLGCEQERLEETTGIIRDVLGPNISIFFSNSQWNGFMHFDMSNYKSLRVLHLSLTWLNVSSIARKPVRSTSKHFSSKPMVKLRSREHVHHGDLFKAPSFNAMSEVWIHIFCSRKHWFLALEIFFIHLLWNSDIQRWSFFCWWSMVFWG